jgi:hypothetical protein
MLAHPLILGGWAWSTGHDADGPIGCGGASPWPANPEFLKVGRRGSELAGVSGRWLEAIRLHTAARVDQGEDGEDDVLGERSPGCTQAFETGVNRCQIV